MPLFSMHRRLAVVVGIGTFFDLYDIFLGGVLAAVLAEEWDLSTNGKALVIASGFAGMFFGAITFGSLADRFGRRRMFLINLFVYSGFSLARGLLALARLAGRAALHERPRAGRRADARRHLPERAAARARARPLHRLGVHVRLRRRPAGGVRGREVRRRHAPADRRLALAADHRRARRGDRVGAAAQPPGVTALARDTRPHARRRRRARGRSRRRRCASSTSPSLPEPADDDDGARQAARRELPRDLLPALPAPQHDAVHLPGAADRRLLRLRHAGAARARVQGLRDRRDARLLGRDLPRLPARLGGLDPARRALRAQDADHRRPRSRWRCSA